MKKLLAETNWREAGLLAALLLLLGFLWDTSLVYPLKILVVFFHELSHAVAAWMTGGHVQSIELSRAQGGVCFIAGGNAFLVTSAGYLGSLLWGGLILVLAGRTRADKAVTVTLGLILLVVSALLVRPLLGFGFVFGMLTGAGLLGTGLLLPNPVNDFVLRVVGLTSCVYAVLDIKSDVLDRPSLRSDAYMLAELTGLPTLFWGVLWIAIALVGAAWFLLLTSRKPQSS